MKGFCSHYLFDTGCFYKQSGSFIVLKKLLIFDFRKAAG